MVRIRFRRMGLRGQPSYRIVAADKETSRDGRFLEILGFYNPRTEPATINVKEDRVFHWMKNGALPTESVGQVFKTSGLLERFERFKKGEGLEVLLKEATEATRAARSSGPDSQGLDRLGCSLRQSGSRLEPDEANVMKELIEYIAKSLVDHPEAGAGARHPAAASVCAWN